MLQDLLQKESSKMIQNDDYESQKKQKNFIFSLFMR